MEWNNKEEAGKRGKEKTDAHGTLLNKVWREVDRCASKKPHLYLSHCSAIRVDTMAKATYKIKYLIGGLLPVSEG